MKKLFSCFSSSNDANLSSDAPSAPSSGSVFDRLNVERNGKLTLVKLWEQVRALSIEKNVAALCPNLRDFTYLVQWTGADCGGHGSILIDRFLAAVLGIQERRNMKIEFITHYDSPQFCDGVQILRQELRRCAKTLDGKYNFRIPFDLLDKDKSGYIVASEFEEAIRELGIQKYMSDQEVKSLMRRFDLNADGGIDFDEFVRFNLAESSSSVSAASPDFDNKREYLSRERRDTEDGSDVNAVLQKIVMQEHLNSSTIVTFCASMQRMFGILDRESTGSISTTTFQQVIKELGLLSDEDDDMKKLVDAFSCDQLQKKMYYREFCDKLEQCALLKGYHSRNEEEVSSEVHIHSDITNRPDEAMKLLRRLHAQYCDLLRHLPKEEQEICKDVFREVFEIEDDCKNRFISLNVEELREVLWRAGLRHPYLREELEILLQCFTVVKENGTGFSVQLFLDLLDKGPTPTFLTTSTEHVSVLFEDHVRRLQRVLQDYIDASGEGVNSQERLISLFTQCDADRNGTISRKEFMFMLDQAGLRSHFKRGGKDEALLLHFMDVNGDGEVGIDEFVTFVKNANINVVKEKAEGKLEDNDKKLENTLSQSITRTESLGSSHVDQVEQKPNEELDKEPEDQKTPLQTAKKLIESEEKSHLKLVREIAICNGKLPEKFPFKCLFEKHCITMTTTTKDKVEERCMPPRKAVSMDIFQDIFGRFVQELMKERIKFNMRTFDATRVLLPYVRTINDSKSFVSYKLFLRDLKHAEFDIKQSNAKETKGSQSQVRLACNNKNTRAYLAHKVIARAIQDAYQNEKELRSFKLQLECLKYEREEKRSHKLEGQSSTEQDVFDALIRLGLRLDAQDLEQCILPKIEESSELGCSSGSFSYNIDSLLTIVQEELYAAVEVEKDAVGNVTKKSLRLSQSLRSRLVRCFVNAAQNNISGRKLLERCDPNKTGIISVVECQTVLRVLDCEISTNDMNEIEQQFGTREKNGCSLQIRYTDLLNLLEHMEAQERQYHDRKHPCSPQKESPRRHLSQKIGNSQEPILSTNCSMQDHKALRERLKYALMEVTRLRGVTLEQFKKSVRSYDVNGTGFVTVDGFLAALRRLDIILNAEAAETMNRCFRIGGLQSDRIDYIELFDMLEKREVVNLDTLFGSIPIQSKCNPLSRSAYHQVSDRATKSPVKQHRTSLASPVRLSQPLKPADRAASHCVHDKTNDKNWACHVCFHIQTKPTRNCEICAAENPAKSSNQALQQCPKCYYRNSRNSRKCNLCHSLLHKRRM